MQEVIFQDLGLIDYKKAWDYQEWLHKELVDRKLKRRESERRGESEKVGKWEREKMARREVAENNLEIIENSGHSASLHASSSPTFSPAHFLLFCEHPHVYTLGKSGKPSHLLINENELKQNRADF